MKHVEIGAFDAKTHFSQLLKQVEEGAVIHITRRGKHVALLMEETTDKLETGKNAVKRIRNRRNAINRVSSISFDDIFSFRDEGWK